MLAVTICGPESALDTILDVQDERGARLAVLQPCGRRRIKDALPLDDERIAVIDESYVVQIVAVPDGRCLATVEAPRMIEPYLRYFPHCGLLAVWNEHCFAFYDPHTLAPRLVASGIIWNGDEGRLIDTGIGTRTDREVRHGERRPWYETRSPDPFPKSKGFTLLGFAAETEREGVITQYLDEQLLGLYDLTPEEIQERRGPIADLSELANVYYLLHVDVAKARVTRKEIDRVYDYPVENMLRHFSPDGCFAVRADMDRLRARTVTTASSKTGIRRGTEPRRGTFGKRGGSHRDLLADGRRRYAQGIEIWSTTEQTCLTRVDIAWLQVENHEQAKHLDGIVERCEQGVRARALMPSNMHLSKKTRYDRGSWVHAWRNFFIGGVVSNTSGRGWKGDDRLIWEPDSAGFWIRTDGGLFRRIGLDGQISPFFKFERLIEPEPQSIDALKAAASLAPETAKVKGAGAIRGFSLEDGSVVVELDDGALRFSTDLLGRPQQTISLSRQQDGYVKRLPRRTAPELTDDDLAPFYKQEIVLDALDEISICQALETFARSIADRLEPMFQENPSQMSFEWTFKSPQGRIDEMSFFALAQEQEWDIERELCQTLEAWNRAMSDGARRKIYCEIWGGFDEEGDEYRAMDPLVRYLAGHSRAALPALSTFLAQRNGDHETYNVMEVTDDVLAAQGLEDEAMMRFVIHATLIRFRDSLYYDRPFGVFNPTVWNMYGQLDAAERIMSGRQFADLVIDECCRFDGVLADKKSNYRRFYLALLRYGAERGDWGQAMAERLWQQRREVTLLKDFGRKLLWRSSAT